VLLNGDRFRSLDPKAGKLAARDGLKTLGGTAR